VNLLAPVVNVATGTARQVVLVDSRYGLRHSLPQLESQSKATAGEEK